MNNSQSEYQKKLRHPKWQKKRLQILQETDFRCSICDNDDLELQVHHIYYEKGKDPWDYPNESLLGLCIKCHQTRVHEKNELFIDLPDLSRYHVAEYQHIDDFRAIRALREYFHPLFQYSNVSEKYIKVLENELRSRLEKLFRRHDWEGDGNINCIFIPPCFYANSDTHCETVFHVKQYNNGSSFLAIPDRLRFEMPLGSK